MTNRYQGVPVPETLTVARIAEIRRDWKKGRGETTLNEHEAILSLAQWALREMQSTEANCAARPISEWTDDDGDVLLWRFPINEPPRVGSLLDTWWKLNPHYYTHWTPLPKAPSQYVKVAD